jgi:hypothetical protein
MPRWQPVERDARYRKRRRAGFPVAVSEGDSWFDYPFFLNIIDLVENADLFAHYRLEQSGDTVKNMIGTATGVRNLRLIVEQVQPLCVLFSGGGNDLADAAATLFVPGAESDPLTCVDEPAVRALLGTIEDRYRVMVREIGPIAPIIAHGYDYFAPSPAPVRFNGIAIGIGPWIHPAMVAQGITSPAAQRTIARWLIDEFHLMLEHVQQDHPLSFVAVDLRGTLDIDADWENEIHPTRVGFRKVAAVFIEAIRDRLPDIVHERIVDRLIVNP